MTGTRASVNAAWSLGHSSLRQASLRQASEGSEVAEFAMILPMLFLALIGIFWFGQAFHLYVAMTNAARDGVRAAVAPGCTTCTGVDPSQNAWNAIKTDLSAAHINPNLLQKPAAPPALCACSPTGVITGCSSTTVACDGLVGNICVQGVSHPNGNTNPALDGGVQLSSTVAGSPTVPGGAGECGVSVSFQYPYKFWLPFTTLNNQTVNLRAQAQMRVETQ